MSYFTIAPEDQMRSAQDRLDKALKDAERTERRYRRVPGFRNEVTFLSAIKLVREARAQVEEWTA